MAFLIVGTPSEPTCSAIVAAACELGLEAAALEPSRLSRSARVGDVVLGRLSVRASLAGVERGLDELSRAVARGIFVLNPPRASSPRATSSRRRSGSTAPACHGAVVQELLPVERELRLVVPGGRIVAGAEGAPAAAPRLALAAAAATETDVVAVDLVEHANRLAVLDLDPAPELEDARLLVEALFADTAPALPRIA